MTTDDYPTLANFFATWFTTAHDFDELEAVLDLMRRLDADENLRDLQKEVRRVQDEGVRLADFNAFSLANDGRRFTPGRYRRFLDIVLERPVGAG